MPADAPALLGKLLAARQVDARELEERDLRRCRRPRSRAAAATSPSSERRPQDRLVAAHRVGQPDRIRVGIGRDEAPGVRLAEARRRRARPRRTRRSRCSRVRWPATARRSGIVSGHAVEHDRATSSTTSISRVTSRARQVGTVTSQSLAHLEAEPLEDARAAPSGATSRPTTLSVRSRPKPDDRAARAGPSARPRCPSARRRSRSTIRRLASTAAGSARCGSTPFSQRFEPSVRRPSRSDVCRIPIGSKFAASSSTSVVSSATSLSCAAHDRRERDGLRAVGDQEVALVERARACRRASAAPRRPPRGGRRCDRRRASRGRTRASGLP